MTVWNDLETTLAGPPARVARRAWLPDLLELTGMTLPVAWLRGALDDLGHLVRATAVVAWPTCLLGARRAAAAQAHADAGAARAVAVERSPAAARAAAVVARRRARLARRSGRLVAWLVIAAGLAAFAASLAVPAWFEVHGQKLLIVTSGSMSPFVEAGDVVVLQAIDDASQLRVGQVATFWPPGGKHLVTHRIVDLQMLPSMVPDAATGEMVPQLDLATGEVVERPFILTKGDANETVDPNATPLSRVRGVVVQAHAGWGTLLFWAHSPQGRMVMLVPPLALIAALELADTLAERRRARRRPAPPLREARFDALLLD